MSFVLDASIAVRWALKDDDTTHLAAAMAILKRLSHEQAYVPCIWYSEVSNVLNRARKTGNINAAQCSLFYTHLASLAITRYDCAATQAFTSISECAHRFMLSAYDASYLELSLRLGIPIATFDKDLQRAARNAKIELLVG